MPIHPSITELPDEALMTFVRAGHADAYGILVQRHSDALYRLGMHMTGSREAAAHIVRTAFLEAYGRLDNLDGQFGALVFRIVSAECKDWLNTVRPRHRVDGEDTAPSPWTGPADRADRTELAAQLDAAIAHLPVTLREAFVLRHMEGRSYEEMADLLDSTVDVLKLRVRRARELLKTLLAPPCRAA